MTEYFIRGSRLLVFMGKAKSIGRNAPNGDEVWIIGGSSIYKEFISSVKELYITEIDGDFECDTFFVEEFKSFFPECEVRYGGIMNEKYTFFYKKYFS